MDEDRKNAYRYLLYGAMTDIRGIEWITYKPYRLLNPFELIRGLRRASRAGALCNWLHNLAKFSAEDFNGFNEERFWSEYDEMIRIHGEMQDYRVSFEHDLDQIKRRIDTSLCD